MPSNPQLKVGCIVKMTTDYILEEKEVWFSLLSSNLFPYIYGGVKDYDGCEGYRAS